jgi:UPF0755 protein
LKGIHFYLAKIFFGLYLIIQVVYYYLKKFRLVFSIFFFFFILAIIFIYLSYFPHYSPPDLTSTENKIVHIPDGSSFNQITNILVENNVLKDKRVFVLMGKLLGYQNKIQAGHLLIPLDLSPWYLLNYLKHPLRASLKVTIPEGLQTHKIASLLKKQLGIDSLRFMNLVFQGDLMESLGIEDEVENLEGYLLPETYFFPFEVDEKFIIRLLVENTLKIFETDSVRKQMDLLTLSRHEILTLASIIEGEVMVDSERVIISSVYHNRLNRGWLLQADPTIQYILPGSPRRLYLKDLQIDSPYNTYKYKGLPPGPINNPGKRSIMAAIFPAQTSYLFFVARGDGGHNFATNTDEHLKNKAKFDVVRKNSN